MANNGSISYTYMNSSIYALLLNQSSFQWNIIENVSKVSPVLGLTHYGLQTTESSKLVLYGGLRRIQSRSSQKRTQTFTSYNHLWVFDFYSGFKQIPWEFSGGGFSRIISLGGERLCILNSRMKEGAVMLYLDLLRFYPLNFINNIPSERNGYAIISHDVSNFYLIGGYNENKEVISDVDPKVMVYRMTFLSKQSYLNDFLITIVILIIVIIILSVLSIIGIYKIRNNDVSEKEMKGNFTIPLELSQCQQETTTTMNAESATGTSFFNNTTFFDFKDPVLYIPLFKTSKFNEDFLLKQLIARGGFGNVYFGIISNEEIAKENNNGSKECVVKLPSQSIMKELFLQEISIQEVFRHEKYFSKLICYSEEPLSIWYVTFFCFPDKTFYTERKFQTK
jgi:hypothetical protein